MKSCCEWCRGLKDLILEQQRKCRVTKITADSEKRSRLCARKTRKEMKPAEREPVKEVERKLVLERREKKL